MDVPRPRDPPDVPSPGPSFPPTARATPGDSRLVIVLVVALVVGVLLGAVALVGLLSGLLVPPVTRPVVKLSSADQADGNATMTILTLSQESLPDDYRFRLQANTTIGPTTSLPPSGASTIVALAADRFQVSWDDADGDRFVSAGDVFRVSGDGGRLPTSTLFVFQLRWSDGVPVGAVVWST